MDSTQRTKKTGHESQDLIPRQKVARMFGVCTRTVKRWEPLHNLTPHRITSRLTAYPADEIERIKSDSRATQRVAA